MKRILTAGIAFIAAAAVIFYGCEKKEAEKVQEQNIISGIRTGMTSDEVFGIVGRDYDNKLETETYKKTVEYDYTVEPGEALGTDIGGYMFFEFDSESDKLLTYGYHLGQNGSYDAPAYPHTADELKNTCDIITATLSKWYGEGSQSSENAGYGVLDEYSWQTDSGQVWVMYGVNLWAMSEPAKYEEGLNEIVVSCSVAEAPSE